LLSDNKIVDSNTSFSDIQSVSDAAMQNLVFKCIAEIKTSVTKRSSNNGNFYLSAKISFGMLSTAAFAFEKVNE